MLISHSRQFMFVHIAKTGGTSVRAALRKYRWSGRYGPAILAASLMSQMTRPRHKLGVKFPRHAKAIAAHEMLPAEVYRGLFKFVFVRNPWDLQVSSWHHIGREKPNVLGPVKSFEDFLKLKFDPERPYDYMLDISRELQSDYIVDLHGNTIVDFIGRYENLEEDFGHICERIGIPLLPLPHERRADNREDYRRYYTDVTTELVARHYAADINRLGYSFE
ncbi:MAG: sulfotransferase family 2 domain-containing protein [Halofilum sp. (in: g-proteobacteria)]